MEARPPNVIEFLLRRHAAHVVEGIAVYVEKIWAPVRFGPLLGMGGGILGDSVLHLDYDRHEIRLEKRDKA
jgi:hypothetical protein